MTSRVRRAAGVDDSETGSGQDDEDGSGLSTPTTEQVRTEAPPRRTTVTSQPDTAPTESSPDQFPGPAAGSTSSN